MDAASLFDVKGKVVLVTGGAKGIGRMIAQGFVSNGAKVYITGRDAEACHAAAAELSSSSSSSSSSSTPSSSSSSSPATSPGGSAHALPADLQHLAECHRLVEQLTALEPAGLHVLVNNAGAAWGDSIDAYPDHAWTKVLTLNLHRVFTLTQLCLPLLEKASSSSSSSSPSSSASPPSPSSLDSSPSVSSDPARIIHIGSIDGLRVPTVTNFAYSASKAGLHHLSRALARDLGPRGVTSNVVACGPFPTKMMRATLDSFGDAIRQEVPLGRVGTPEDVAGACLFLASRAGAYCNGALIRLDGGASLASKI